MTTSLIKKTLLGAALSLALSFQLVSPASAATNEALLAASQKGINYLAASQSANGGVVGLSDVTDWAVIAVVANGGDPDAFSKNGVSAMDYLLAHPLTSAALATDVEKRILAIVAADEDTTDFGNVDYNELLTTYHNNNQIGDPILLNDDIFGLIAIAALDDPSLMDMADDALDYLIAHQDVNGGFSYTTDTCAYCGADSNDTAAAIIALEAAESLGLTNANLDTAKAAALAYLLSTQQLDGGFGYDNSGFSPSDGSSTSWALMALNSLGSTVVSEAAAAQDWLLANQNTDGGFSYGAFGYTDSDVTTTAHAVIALLGTNWLMQPEPLQHPVVIPTPPAPTSAVQSVTITSGHQVNNPNPQPIVTAVATATALPQPTPEPTAPSPTDVSAAETATPEATNPVKKPNYMMLGTGILILVAVIWYVLQSKSKPGKK